MIRQDIKSIMMAHEPLMVAMENLERELQMGAKVLNLDVF